MSSQKYLKRIDKKMDRLLEIAEQFAPVPPAPVTEEPFYFQASSIAEPVTTEPVEFELNEAPSIKTSGLNNWNRYVTGVLANMKSSGWKSANGRNATRRNAMKEASRRKAEVNANYAATATSRRAKRNKQLASKAALAAFNATGAPPATATNVANALVNTTAAAALLAGPPRKGIDPPPAIYKKFKGPKVTNSSSSAPAQSVSRILRESLAKPNLHPQLRRKYEKELKELEPNVASEIAAGIQLESKWKLPLATLEEKLKNESLKPELRAKFEVIRNNYRKKVALGE